MPIRVGGGDAWQIARRRGQSRLRRQRRVAVLGSLMVVGLIAAAAAGWIGGGSSKRASPPPAVTPTLSATGARSMRRASPAGRSAPGARRQPGTEAVPILIYHVIAQPPAGAPFPGLYVPPGEFSAQMRALARAGYHAVTLDQVRGAWLRGTPLPPHPVVLTFDNGYRTQYTQALPVLRRLHWVGDENLQLTGLPPSQGGLRTAQVKGLVAAGWELDTQGFSHADLPVLDASELHYQVAVARRVIRRRYHVAADWFCYPSGDYDPTVIAAVKAAGYVGATTVVPGWAAPRDDPYRLPRLRVLRGTTPQELLGLIASTRVEAIPPPSYLTG